jgi:hypothetical protein
VNEAGCDLAVASVLPGREKGGFSNIGDEDIVLNRDRLRLQNGAVIRFASIC